MQSVIKKNGRPKKPHVTAWNEAISGLTRMGDGRWRVDTGAKEIRFSERDERVAVEKAKKLLGLGQYQTTTIEITVGDLIPDAPNTIAELNNRQMDILNNIWRDDELPEAEADTLAELPLQWRVPDAILWPWLSNMLRNRLDHVAKMTAYPDLLRIRHLPPPSPSIRLSAIKKYYLDSNPSKNKTRTTQQFDLMVKHCNATTLTASCNLP
jgi:hypothetical protein